MNMFQRFIYVVRYGHTLDKAIRYVEREQREMERAEKFYNLDLCKKHQQRSPGTHYAEHNCHYCQLLALYENRSESHEGTTSGTSGDPESHPP